MNTLNNKSFPTKYNGETVDIFKQDWIEVSTLIAIAGKEILWNDINQEYENEKTEAILSYHGSTLYNMAILETLTTPVRLMTIKAMSLYTAHIRRNTPENWMISKLEKGFNRYVNYFRNSNTLDFNALMKYMDERDPDFTEAQKHDVLVTSLYLCKQEDLASNKNNPILNNTIRSIINNFTVISNQDDFFMEKKKDIEKEGLQGLSDILGFKVPREMNLDKLIEKHELFLLNHKISPSEKRHSFNQDTFDILNKLGLYRYHKPLTGVLRLYNINDFNFLSTVNIKRDELLNIYTMFEIANSQGRLQKDEWESFFTASLLLIMLTKNYKQLTSYTLQQMNHEEKQAIKEEQAVTAKSDWEQNKKEIEAKQILLEDKLDKQDSYILELEKKVKDYEQRFKKEDSYKKEVLALRAYAYAHAHQEDYNSTPSNEVTKENALKQWTSTNKAVVFGGHPSFINKLKRALPEIEFRDVDTLNRDLSFLRNVKIIFLLTNYFNHPFYYKLMKELESLPETSLVYLTGYTNLERTVDEMLSGIESLS